MRELFLGVASLCLLVGCNVNNPALNGEASAKSRVDAKQATDATAGDVQLVTLSLPNMTCPICAKEVRTDLAKLDGVSDVETDVSGKSCTFKLGDQELDLEAKLQELAADNESLKGFKVVKK
jgi:copper chaperone CopZ